MLKVLVALVTGLDQSITDVSNTELTFGFRLN